MFTQKFKAKIYVEGSNFPIEVETEAMNRQQAQKIFESKYKIKKMVCTSCSRPCE